MSQVLNVRADAVRELVEKRLVHGSDHLLAGLRRRACWLYFRRHGSILFRAEPSANLECFTDRIVRIIVKIGKSLEI